MSARLRTLCLAVAAGGLLAACDASGSGGPTATPTVNAGAAGPSAVDRCLVGAWKSTSISGTVTISGAHVTLRGGAGEVITIGAGGTIHTDDSTTTPVGGVAPNGTDYRLSQSGMATGTIRSSAGRIKVDLNQPTTLAVTLYKNGTAIETQHPGSANDTYTCTPGTSLVVTGGGGTVTRYLPA